MTLRWSGDYTLPRLRAKLAGGKPGAEPDYAELYRPDLSAVSILRKESPEFYAALAETGGFDAFNHTTASFGGMTKGGHAASATMSGANRTGFFATARSSQGFGQTGSFGRTGSLSQSQSMTRTNSVPVLGSRRVERAPASLEPLPPTWNSASASSLPGLGTMIKSPSTASMPTQKVPVPLSGDDAKALAKEKEAEAASRRLWTAVHGSELHVKEHIQLFQAEGPQTNAVLLGKLSKSPVPGMNRAMKLGAKIDWQNPEWDGATLLIKSIRNGSLQLAMYCLSLGADITMTDNSERGVLHWAAVYGDAKMMSYFLTEYPDLDMSAADGGGDTPLHLASYHGHLPVVRLLLRGGAKEAENEGGFTPTQLSEARRMWHVASYLKEQKADDLEKEDLGLRDLVRPCNLARANELKAVEAV